MSRSKLIALAAGGTGGHVFPAQAAAEVLRSRGLGIVLITDKRGGGYKGALGDSETHVVNAAGLGGGVVGAIRGAAIISAGLVQAWRLLKKLRPDVVVGFGGYPSVPTMMAATRLGLATLIHEQNAVLGKANALVASRVLRIATSFDDVVGIDAAGASKAVLTGNPVRAEIAELREAGYEPPANDAKVRLLVFGGSQGARILSEVVPSAVASLEPSLRSRLEIVQQCRPEDIETAREMYDRAGVNATLASFFDDIPMRLSETHLVISRSGASTIAELTTVGRPAILIPYPHATEDHQTANARSLERSGGAWVIPQGELTADVLAEKLRVLMASPEALRDVANRSHSCGEPHAAEKLATAIAALAGFEGNGGHKDTTPREEAA